MTAVVSAVERGDVEAAQRLLERVDRDALWLYYDAAGAVWQSRHVGRAHEGRVGVKRSAINVATNTEIARRDGWRCRYCGVRLLSFDCIRAIHTCLRDLFVIDPINERKMHPVAFLLRYTPDHVVPRSAGGANDPDNLVAACGVCQYQKGDCTLAELGLSDPRIRSPRTDGWDGLSGRLGRVRF